MASYPLEYTPYPTIQPSGAPPGEERISASPEMFGGLIAQSEEKLGGALEKTSQEGFSVLAARAQLNNEVHASEKLTWAASRFGNEWEGFKQKEGKAAAMALPDYQKTLKGIYDDTLKDEPLAVQAHLSRSLSSLMDRFQGWGAGHAGAQERQWHDKVAGDQSKEFGSQAVLAAHNGTWDQVEQSLRASDDGVRKLLEQKGYGTDAESANALNFEISKNRGSNVTAIVKDLVDRGDTKTAQAVIDRYKDKVDKDSLVRMDAAVKQANAQTEGIGITKQVVGRGPLTPFDLVAVGETGRAGRERQAQIATDTGGSKSYGLLGLNSRSGSAALFAREHPDLGLTAQPGSDAFNRQWVAAAETNGDALYRAQQQYYADHIVAPMKEQLAAAGVPANVAANPRVIAYMADRRVQMGDVGLSAALEAASGTATPEAFLAAVSATDRARLDQNFPSYLAEHPANRQGLLNRIDTRWRMSAAASEEGSSFDYPTALGEVMRRTEDKSPAVRQAALSWLSHLHQVQQASFTDQERAWRQQEHVRHQLADQAFDDVLAGKLTASQILADNRVHGRDREHALALLDRTNKTVDIPAAAATRNTKALYDRLHLAEGDPRRITDTRAIDDAFISTDPAVGISQAQHEFLVRSFRENRDNQGDPFLKQKQEFYKAIEPMIDKSLMSGIDVTGEGKLHFLRFVRDTDAKLAKLRKEGKTEEMQKLIDPSSYLGDNPLYSIAPYIPGAQRALGPAAAAQPNATPGPPGTKRLPGETIEAWMARNKVGIGPAPAGPAPPVVPQSQ